RRAPDVPVPPWKPRRGWQLPQAVTWVDGGRAEGHARPGPGSRPHGRRIRSDPLPSRARAHLRRARPFLGALVRALCLQALACFPLAVATERLARAAGAR